MSARFYLDTSAYLCVLLGEDGSAALSRQLASAQILSSVLLVLEAKRNLVRLGRQGDLGAAALNDVMDRLHEDLTLFALRDLTLDLCTDLRLPLVSTPRSLDLVHLRTALWFHAQAPIDAFVTNDEQQRASARELGLPV